MSSSFGRNRITVICALVFAGCAIPNVPKSRPGEAVGDGGDPLEGSEDTVIPPRAMVGTGGSNAVGSGGTFAANGGVPNLSPGQGGAGGKPGAELPGSGGTGSGGAGGRASGGAGGRGGQIDAGRLPVSGSDARSATGAGGAGVGGAPDARDRISTIYDPCPAAGTPCRIMPLGDSITEGIGSSTAAGYRISLFRLAVSGNKKITFVGSADPSGPARLDGVPFPRQHEGHAGQTATELSKLVDTSLAANKPNIVLLHIGTNDGEDDSRRPNITDLGTLIDKLVASAPNALVVVAQIIPVNDDDAVINMSTDTYNAAMTGLIKTRADTGKHVVLVDMNKAFNANLAQYMADEVHPNDAGYKVMGEVWYQAIAGILR